MTTRPRKMVLFDERRFFIENYIGKMKSLLQQSARLVLIARPARVGSRAVNISLAVGWLNSGSGDGGANDQSKNSSSNMAQPTR